MRKVTKISLRIVSTIALLLIIIPVTLAVLLSIPRIQNLVIDRTTKAVSELLGTRVEIGEITLGLLNRVSVRDFYVEDLDGDTLLYVNRANAYLSSLASLPKGLTINYGSVEGGKFILRETLRGETNVKEVTDRIPKKKEKGNFQLIIRSLNGENIDFRLHRPVSRYKGAGVDYDNMQLLGIDTHIEDFMVQGEAVSGDIERLSFVERSGFTLEKLSGYFFVHEGQIKVEGAKIKSTSSKINLKSLHLDGADWLIYNDFINNVPIICRVEDSTVSTDDVGYFAPEMWQWQTSISNADLEMNGTVADFAAKVDHATTEEGGTIIASAKVKGLIDVPKTKFDIKIKSLDASTDEVVYLLHNIAHIDLNEKTEMYTLRTKHLSTSGAFKGTINDFTINANIGVGSGGEFGLNGSINTNDGKRHFVANLNAKSADLKEILLNDTFGATSLVASINGSFGNGEFALKGNSDIESVHLLGHDYKSISLTADITNKQILGAITINDSALKAEGQAFADFGEDTPKYDAVLSIADADLHAMQINKRDTISLIKGDVGLSLQGATLDELNGVIRVADAEYLTNNNSCNADLVELAINCDEDSRTLTLTSDFADAVFESRTKYKNVIYYLKNIFTQYAPLLYDNEMRSNINRHIEEIGDEVAMLSVATKNIDPLLGCITSGLEMAEGSSLQMLINPADNRFMMRASSDFIMHNNYLATELDLKAGNAGDSLSIAVEANDLYVGVAHLSHVGVSGGAKNNKLNLVGHFADSVRDVSGEVSATARLSRHNGIRRVAIGLNPTHIQMGDKTWDITTGGIEIDSTRVNIRHFAMQNESQGLYVDGVMSRSERDSIHIRLNNFSLSPFTQITSPLGYHIDGSTNGYATIHSALKNSRINAHIELDGVNVNGVDAPDMLLTSQWDFGSSRASLNIATREDNKSIIRGYYAPSQMRYYARMRSNDIDLSLLDPLLKDVISETKGFADVDLTFAGISRDAELSGEILVRDLSTKVDYINCRYSAPKATIQVKNNKFVAANVPIFDANQNRGSLSIDFSLAHLSNIEYNVGIRINDMQVLNTTEKDNPMFYGTVFASGSGSIRGDKAGTKMDFVARSEDNSKFFMPLTDKSDIESADFVTFATRSNTDTTSYLVRKKLMFENRQKRRTTGASSAMDITMALDVRPNAEVQLVIDPTVGDIIKGRGEGLLNLRINPQSNIFEMYGDYTIASGSYLFTLQNIINKWFDIQPGSTIQWTGEPLDAQLNIDAIYHLKASLQPLVEGSISGGNISSRAVPVECYIHLTDRLTQPTVNFDVVVPDADSEVQSIIASTLATPESKSQQFLYLIIANSFVSESSNASASIGATSAAATTGFEMLSNQLSNWLSSDDYKIVVRYRPRTAQMSDEVDFGFSKGLINNRLILEVEGNYIVDKTQVVNATSNFTGEAYLTWLIDRTGALRLKGFTHTIDRFDENQGLQETGVGIYFKEDFENSRNLQQRVAARFRREKKGERSPKVEKSEKSNSNQKAENRKSDK